MDYITLLEECLIKVEEIKEEIDDITDNAGYDILENSTVTTEYSGYEMQVKKENESEEDSLALSGDTSFKTPKETKAGFWIPGEQVTFEEMKNEADAASGGGSNSNRTEYPSEEREASKREHRKTPQLLTLNTWQRKFTGRKAVGDQIKVHVKEAKKKSKFQCGTCGKDFSQRGHLNVHLRLHTGEKPYVCDRCGKSCGKSFPQRTALNVHRYKHTGEYPYSCSACNKQFGGKTQFETHTRRHLNIRPYECKECGKTFVESKDCKQHLRIHTGEKPYKCSVCSKIFSQMGTLKRHMLIHSSDAQKQMLECELCGNSVRTTSMISHIRTHTGEKAYKCRFCEAAFRQSRSRLRHEEIHTGRKQFQCKETVQMWLL